MGSVSFDSSVQSRTGSDRKSKQPKKTPKVPKQYAAALLKYDPSTIQSIQAKMHKEGARGADFRSVWNRPNKN